VVIYEQPANEFVADFIGSPSINLIKGEFTAAGPVVNGMLLSKRAEIKGNGPLTVGIRPEDVILDNPGSGGLDGRIDFTEPQGGVVYTFVTLDGDRNPLKNRDHIVVSMDVHQPIEVGASVGLRFREERISFFDADSGIAVSGKDI
jgi:multiple sugar transport system ATP-binding protein